MADMSVHHPTARSGHVTRPLTLESVSEAAAYWLSLFGVYLLVGYLMFSSAAEKLFVGQIAMPAPLAKTFASTWVAKLVGVNFLWGFLGVLELAVLLVMLASLVRGEFLPSRSKVLLQASLALTLVLFAILAFGEVITANFAGVATQYTYFGMTILIMGLVGMLPPNRSAHWLTRDVSSAEKNEAAPE